MECQFYIEDDNGDRSCHKLVSYEIKNKKEYSLIFHLKSYDFEVSYELHSDLVHENIKEIETYLCETMTKLQTEGGTLAVIEYLQRNYVSIGIESETPDDTEIWRFTGMKK